MMASFGISWSRRPSRFATVPSVLKKLTPVMLPPGRLRLVTRPISIGSKPVEKMTGMVVVAALAANDEASSAGDDHGDLTADQIGCHRRKPIELIIREAIFDRYVPPLNIAGLP